MCEQITTHALKVLTTSPNRSLRITPTLEVRFQSALMPTHSILELLARHLLVEKAMIELEHLPLNRKASMANFTTKPMIKFRHFYKVTLEMSVTNTTPFDIDDAIAPAAV
jgi:hypothetical protein